MNAGSVVDRYPTRLVSSDPTPIPRTDPVVWGDGTGPMSDRALADFEREGFASFGALVSAGEAADLLAEAHRIASDPSRRGDARNVCEPGSDEVRSVFEVHRTSARFAAIAGDPRLAGIARQVLGSPVTIHQSRINLKPGFAGKEFDWHSDFETWHAEDGLAAMRTVSISLALTPNYESNGPLMIIPGSHHTFVPCVGETPQDHFRSSLRRQQVGVPDKAIIASLAESAGVRVFTGGAGSAVVFDSNCLHGSNSNISPFPRSNFFVVYNSAENGPVEPFAAEAPRPDFIAAREPAVI